MRRFTTPLVVVLALLALTAAAAGAAPVTPPGWQVAISEELAPGVVHQRLVRQGPAQSVHVARVAPSAPVELQAVLSQDRVGGQQPRLERTSAMCARAGCLAAVNADFFARTREPVGGMVVDGEVVRSANPLHHQVLVGDDGTLSTGSFEMGATLVTTDLGELTVGALNVDRTEDATVLYTPRWGASTNTNPHGAELVVRVLRPSPPLVVDQTYVVELTELRDGAGDTPIPADGVVLSGHGEGADRLRALWQDVADGRAGRRGLLRLTSPDDVEESVGGTPILVRDGQRWFEPDGRNFVRGRHPRTLVGWTAEDETLLVTVDGRQPGHGAGMSLAEAADLMIALGAVEAINLDGGGSTTFVTGGHVRNQPSDLLVQGRDGRTRVAVAARAGEQVVGHLERPVVSALAVVPAQADRPASPEVLGETTLDLPVVDAPAPLPTADPASNPEMALPALVRRTPEEPGPPLLPALAAAGTLVVAAAALGGAAVERRRFRT